MLSRAGPAAKTLTSHTVGDNVQIEGDHVEMAGENETGESKKALPPSLVIEPPPVEQGQEAARMPKTSLPARMTDLYQVAEQLQHRIT